MRNQSKLTGLVAATHTPFHADGSLNLDVVEAQARHLLQNRITTVFIGGSTGESHSLSLEERRQLGRRWMEVVRGTPMQVIVHVGSNCLVDAQALAAEAGRAGVRAIAALAPSYFKPRNLAGLVDWCAAIAAAAPETPFYFYDIPALTQTHFPMPEFLERGAERIPTLAGIKFSHLDLIAYQLCLQSGNGGFDIPFGVDECLLSALVLGGVGAVGSTYNFAAPIYQRLIAAFEAGDLAAARKEQLRSVQLVQVLAEGGYMGRAKAVMGMLGVDVGPARLPNPSPTPQQVNDLRRALEELGFFEWIAPVEPQAAVA